MIQPDNATLTNHPSRAALIAYSDFTNPTTPDITAVSNPNRKPPSAATVQIRIRYFMD
jgi:hypothetical protein